jgi:HTH-type transcriptional regulator/antitoxin HigA
VASEIKRPWTTREYEAALKEVERLWGANVDTPEGNRLDTLASLIDTYEALHWPMGSPDPNNTP